MNTCNTTYLVGFVLHLAGGGQAVAALDGGDGAAHVDVVLVQVGGVKHVQGLPVLTGAGPGQAGRPREKDIRLSKV